MNNFSIVRKGYACDEVDAYITNLETALLNTTNELNSFREKEAAISNSMVDAQLTAEKTIAQAKLDARALRENALIDLNDLREQVLAMHDKVESFQAEYNRILQEYLVSLRSNEMATLFEDLETFMTRLDIRDTEKVSEDAVDLNIPKEI